MYINIESIIDELGINYRRKGNHLSALCPYHSEKTPSWNIEVNEPYRHRCFACNAKGNIYTLYKDKTGESLYKNLNISAINFQFFNELPKKEINDVHNIEDRVELIEGKELDIKLSDEVKDYLYYRGCSKEFIEYYNIKYVRYAKYVDTHDRRTEREMKYYNRVITPIYLEGKLQSIEGRDFTRKSKLKVLYPFGSNVNFLFDYDRLNRNDSIYIVEGIFDLVQLFNLGLRNITCTFGTGISNFQIKQLNKFKEIYIFPDNDKAGEESIKLYRRELQKDFWICNKYNSKDPGDATKEGIENALENKMFSVDYIFNSYNIEEKVEW